MFLASTGVLGTRADSNFNPMGGVSDRSNFCPMGGAESRGGAIGRKGNDWNGIENRGGSITAPSGHEV